jgi:hypothetical protein
MKDLRDLKDSTMHDVQATRGEFIAGNSCRERGRPFQVELV